jgi:hypothetical protein
MDETIAEAWECM